MTHEITLIIIIALLAGYNKIMLQKGFPSIEKREVCRVGLGKL